MVIHDRRPIYKLRVKRREVKLIYNRAGLEQKPTFATITCCSHWQVESSSKYIARKGHIIVGSKVHITVRSTQNKTMSTSGGAEEDNIAIGHQLFSANEENN